MNVFVLCTGRCGSHTFVEACQHISNFTAGHETRSQMVGSERLAYPDQHIEADNRLAWFLGRLNEVYGEDAFYVHLTRDPGAVAASLARRYEWMGSIAATYRDGILKMTRADRVDCCSDYVETVTANIRLFLMDKEWMPFRLETAAEDWPAFWERIGAQGDFAAALAEWSVRHDKGEKGGSLRPRAQRFYHALISR